MYPYHNSRHQWDVQRTDTLGRNSIEIRNVVAKKTRWSIRNNAKNQTMGVVDSQGEIGEYSRNVGLWLATESAKQEHIQTSYTPGLEAVGGNSSATGSGCKRGYGEPKMYNGPEWHDWNLGNLGNFSKYTGNSLNGYKPFTGYGELYGGGETSDFFKYYVTC